MNKDYFLSRIRVAVISAVGAVSLACASAPGGEPSSTDLEQPPSDAVNMAEQTVDANGKESLKFLGPDALHIKSVDHAPNVWLIPLQELSDAYCTFLEVDQEKRTSRELATYVGCHVVSAKFSDFNGDGSIDALYRVRTKSNRYAAWVDEEVLFLFERSGRGFCKSANTPKFARSREDLVCAQ